MLSFNSRWLSPGIESLPEKKQKYKHFYEDDDSTIDVEAPAHAVGYLIDAVIKYGLF